MKNSVIKITALLGSMLCAIGCAKEYPDPNAGVARESFDRWIKSNAPEAVATQDVYIQFIDTASRATLDSIVIPASMQTYLLMDYTASTLNGNIFATRSVPVSRLIGIWSEKTHYCDDYVLAIDGSATISRGLYQGLTQMRQGDSARVYMPGNLGYNDFGLSGSYTDNSVNYKNVPVIVDLRLKEVVKYPEQYELKNLQAFALKEWGQEQRDTVYPGIYMRKLNYNYDGYKITRDSSVWVNYAEYYLDSNFLIKTNIDSLAKAHPEYNSLASNEVNRVPFKIQPGTTSYGEVFRQGLVKMRQGETAEFLVMAKNTKEGVMGNPNNKPELLPYQSKRFVIRVLTEQEYQAQKKK